MSAQPARSAGESLLIVEDDVFVRDSMAHVLHELGYKVTTSHSIDQALKYLRAGLQVDLILVDLHRTYGAAAVNMADALMAQGMQQPVLFIYDKVVGDRALEQSTSVLFKPFSIQTLSEAIRQTLQSTAQAE